MDSALVNLFDDDPPTCRATVRAGAVTLNSWRPGTGPHGPLKAGYFGLAVLGCIAVVKVFMCTQSREGPFTPLPTSRMWLRASRQIARFAQANA